MPANHVTRLIAAGRLDTNDTLRWRGRLRDDPMSLPWGRRYEIDLEDVDIAGTPLPVTGGLRLNLYGNTHAAAAAHRFARGRSRRGAREGTAAAQLSRSGSV